jgi:hypothetical protein
MGEGLGQHFGLFEGIAFFHDVLTPRNVQGVLKLFPSPQGLPVSFEIGPRQIGGDATFPSHRTAIDAGTRAQKAVGAGVDLRPRGKITAFAICHHSARFDGRVQARSA